MRSLGVICARAGSQLRDKNVLPHSGRPLINHTVQVAQDSILTDVVVSTDCDCVKRLAANSVEVIDRPAIYALDTSPIHEAVIHATHWKELAEGENYDAVVCLQNTSPFRSPDDIDEALRLLEKHPDADTVMSVVEADEYHPSLAYRLEQVTGMLTPLTVVDTYRRQDRKPVVFMSGVVFAMRRDALFTERWIPCGKIYPMKISQWRNFDLHDWNDHQYAEHLCKIRWSTDKQWEKHVRSSWLARS